MTSNIVGILKIKGQIYGSNKGKYQYLFQPFDHKLPQYLVYTNINRTQTKGDIIAIIKETDKKESKYFGQIVQKIGCSLDINDLIKGWIYHFQLDQHFKKYPPIQELPIIKHQNMLTNNVYSIDPTGCTDIDDAFDYLELDTGYQLNIHIACLGHLYQSIFIYLLSRGWSLYLPNLTIYHLLPEELVKQFSLLEGESRQVISLVLKLSLTGNIIDYSFQVNQIKSSKQYDYQRIDQLISSGQKYWKKLVDIIQNIRQSNINIFPTSTALDKIDSHLIIETMMILYNYLGCNYLINHGFKPILRQHDKPTSQSNDSITNIPELTKFLSFLDYQSANYTYNQTTHYGLGIKNYGHLTSPLRRAVDAYNQLLLLNQLGLISNIPDTINLDHLNQLETCYRKFYRKCQIYQLYLQFNSRIQKAIIYPYQYNEEQTVVFCYWTEYHLVIKLKLAYLQSKPQLFQKYNVELAILMTGDSLPKIRINYLTTR